MKTKDVLIYILIAVTVWFVADKINGSRGAVVQPVIQSAVQPSGASANSPVHQPHNPVVVPAVPTPVIEVIGLPANPQAPVQTEDPLPNFKLVKTCADTAVYPAPDINRDYFLIVPAGSTMQVEAKLPDLTWVKLYVPEDTVEWWVPMSAMIICD